MNTNIMQVISLKYTPATYSILCLTLPMYAANIQNMNSAGSKLGWQWDIKAITWYENDKLDESYKVSKICIKRSQILIIFILRIFVVVARVSFPNGQLHTGNIHVGSALDTHKIPTHKRFKRMLFIRTKHNIRMLAIILGSNFWTHNTILYIFLCMALSMYITFLQLQSLNSRWWKELHMQTQVHLCDVAVTLK